MFYNLNDKGDILINRIRRI